MTTLAELCLQPPDPTHGKPLQFDYGVGDMMLAFEIADISAGAGIVWHDLSQFFERARWRVGAEAPYGKYRDGNPVVLLRRRFTDGVADFDALAPWYEDTSAVFGSHVRLRGGLIARLGIFRVAGGVTDQWFPLFTSRVKRWSDGARAMGNNRYHQITCMGMQSRLARKPLVSRGPEGWRTRLDDDLLDAGWNLPVEVYGAETEDAGGGAVPTVKLAARPALTSALEALNATLDPVGLVWRITPTGSLLVEPAPWTTFHADKFADPGLTVTGAMRLNPLLGIYPGGRVTFSWSPADEDGQVGFYNYPTDGDGFGIDSDVENVVNEWQITYPVDVDDDTAGTATRNYDDPVSASQFDPLPLPAATWLARNDQVQDDTVDYRAYADLVTPPLHTTIDQQGAFPALAVLGQYDPITVVNATREDRTQVTANGIIRSITHEMAAGRLGTGVTWRAWVQPDLQSSEQTPLLKPVNSLQVTDIREDGATFSWVEPSQSIAPTETQVRMNSGAWIPIAYPAGGFDWFSGLAPKTLYKFEVRLVRKVDDLVTHVSPVREISFITLAATVPTVPDDGDGTVVIVPGGDDECDADWELQRSSDGETWTTVASGDKDDFTYDEATDTWTLDNSSYTFEAGYTYRRRVREVCGGVPGDWVYERPTSIVCEDPAQLGSAPYDDASLVVFVPKICNTQIIEAVTGEAGVKGPAFGGIGVDSSGNYALKSDPLISGVVAYGPANAAIGNLDGDLSEAITVNLGSVPASGSPMAIWRCGGLHIEALYESETTWRVRAKIFIASGGSITTTSSSPLNLDTEYEIFVAHDVENETVSVEVDGTEVATGVAGARINGLAVWMITLPASSYATSAAVWGSTTAVTSVRFDYVSDAPQSWTVPAGVTSILVEAAGGQGGLFSLAGLGGKISARFTVTPGDAFDVYAAAQGSRTGGVAGGWPGGGDGRDVSGPSDGGGGGGYSALIPAGGALADALIVAGGGGGGGASSSNRGGDGGYPSGGAGSPGGGSGGTQVAGGVGDGAGEDGSFGEGGDGLGGTSAFDEGGGGAGSGWYGGGGGNSAGSGGSAGGGGSSYVDPAGSDLVVKNGENAGNGYVVISWSVPIAGGGGGGGGGGEGGNALATGGTITIDTPTLVEHRFTAAGSFELDAAGSLNAAVLIVGGGGGGGTNLGGGGGSGDVRSITPTITSTQSVTVGAGGTSGSNGGSSSFGATTAPGGGAGGTIGAAGANGGSGGGGGGSAGGPAGPGGTATGTNGKNGGAGGPSAGSVRTGGGGGGCGSAGQSGNSGGGNNAGGTGYNAASFGLGSIAGGGGGGSDVAGGAGNAGGGSGGTWPGGTASQAGSAAADFGSGGGGGSRNGGAGGAGHDGVVIVRYDPSSDWTPA